MDIDTQQWNDLYARIPQLEKAGDWRAVADTCLAIAKLHIPDLERSIAFINAATAYGHLGDFAEAFNQLEKAIVQETKHGRFSALERKAALLAEQGRIEESVAIYKQLLLREDLYIADLGRYTQNIQILEQGLKR